MVERRELLFSCEHGGCKVPAAYQSLFRDDQELLRSHRGFDPGALALACQLARDLNAPLIKAEVTRLLVDLNRSPGSPNLFSERVKRLPEPDRQQILENHYQPYRQAVTKQVSELINKGAQVLHLSIHSFIPVLDGQVRAVDLGLLYDPERAKEKSFCRSWQTLLSRKLPGLRVRCNTPYRGVADGLVGWLRRYFPQQDYLGIELEVNQALLTAKQTFPGSVQAALRLSLDELLDAD